MVPKYFNLLSRLDSSYEQKNILKFCCVTIFDFVRPTRRRRRRRAFRLNIFSNIVFRLEAAAHRYRFIIQNWDHVKIRNVF